MLGSIYRSINRSLVDAEKLLELLNEPTDVNDKPGAPDLIISNGEIEFGMRFCPQTLAINSTRLQITLVLRMTVVNQPCAVSRSAFPKGHL